MCGWWDNCLHKKLEWHLSIRFEYLYSYVMSDMNFVQNYPFWIIRILGFTFTEIDCQMRVEIIFLKFCTVERRWRYLVWLKHKGEGALKYAAHHTFILTKCRWPILTTFNRNVLRSLRGHNWVHFAHRL